MALVGGDLIFTSNNNLSISAILMANPTSGTTPWAVGRLTAAASMKTPVPARLPEGKELISYDPVTYQARKQSSSLAYDDGNGNIVGVCSGNINYETGKFSLTGAPPNANFEYSVVHDTVFAGKRDAQEAARANRLVAIHANVINKQMDGSLTVTLY